MGKFEMFRNQTDLESFAAGSTIFQKGDPRTVMFVVKEGEVDILLGNRVVETVGPDRHFRRDGNGRWPGADRVGCRSHRLRLVPIDQRRFQFLIQQTPFFAIEVMRVLVARLRRTDLMVAA